MIYFIEVSEEQYDAIRWAEGRGYTGGLLDTACVENDAALIKIGFEKEHKSWEWADEVDSNEHAFGTCLDSELYLLLWDLRHQIV